MGAICASRRPEVQATQKKMGPAGEAGPDNFPIYAVQTLVSAAMASALEANSGSKPTSTKNFNSIRVGSSVTIT
jgi:hypothetical protein